MSRLVLKRFEKACADLNNFPSSSSISDVQQALDTIFADSYSFDPAVYEKAIECQVFDGLIKVIHPPKSHELHKDVDGIFTNEDGGILKIALVLFFTFMKIGRAILHRNSGIKSIFPLFPEFKNFLDTLKKMLERTAAKPVVVPQKTKDDGTKSNNSGDADSIDHDEREKSTNNEFVLKETVLIRIKASTRIFHFLQWLEPQRLNDKSGLSDFEELLILEGFHVLALKNIAFGLEALKSAAASTSNHSNNNSPTDASADDTDENKSLMTTISDFLNTVVSVLRKSLLFQLPGHTTRPVSKIQWEAVRKLVIQHNLVPFLFHAMSVVADSSICQDGIVRFFDFSIATFLACTLDCPPEDDLKKWQFPVSEVNLIGQRIVHGGFLRPLLRFAKLDNIDTVSQEGEVGTGGSQALIQHRVLLLLRAIDIEKFYFQAFLELDGIAILTKLMDHESQEIRFLTMVMVSALCSARNGWNDRANIAELFISCGIIEKLNRIVSSKAHDLSSRHQAMTAMMTIVYFLRTDVFPAFKDEQEKKQQQERIAELHRMLIEQKLHLAVADAASVFMTEDWIDTRQSDLRDELSLDMFEIAYDLLENAPTNEQAKHILEAINAKNDFGFGSFLSRVIKPGYMSTENTDPAVKKRRMFIRKYFPEPVEENGNKKTNDEVKSESK